MKRSSLICKLRLAAFLTLLCNMNVAAGQDDLDSIINVRKDSVVGVIAGRVALLEDAGGHPVDRINRFEAKTEFWKINHRVDGLDTLRKVDIWHYDTPRLHLESYVEQNGQLIYAVRSVTWMPAGKPAEIQWRYILFFSGKRILHIRSLGHGKAEDPDWDETEVYDRYLLRKSQMTVLSL